MLLQAFGKHIAVNNKIHQPTKKTPKTQKIKNAYQAKLF